jgi:hypothetical protein
VPPGPPPARSPAVRARGDSQSAGRRRSGRTRKGNRWLRTALIEAANSAAGRTRGTYLDAQYLRLKNRRGHSKAIVAVANSILVSAYHVLNEQRSCEELGGDYGCPFRLPRRFGVRGSSTLVPTMLGIGDTPHIRGEGARTQEAQRRDGGAQGGRCELLHRVRGPHRLGLRMRIEEPPRPFVDLVVYDFLSGPAAAMGDEAVTPPRWTDGGTHREEREKRAHPRL